MKFVGLLSGGKDSCYNIQKCIENNHELVCLANLYPNNDEIEINSYMYQSAGHTIIPLQAKCFNKPLIRQSINRLSVNTHLLYDLTSNDEVEDLFVLLTNVLANYNDIKGVSCGAIISNYQRYRLENVCNRLNLIPLTYLWQCDRLLLFKEIINEPIIAILVKVAGAGLDPYKHLGKDLITLQSTLYQLSNNLGLDICGEGGEYESLVLDMPMFTNRIVINESRIVVDQEDSCIGNLHIISANLVDKEPTNLSIKTYSSIDKSLRSLLDGFIDIQSNHIETSTDITISSNLITNRKFTNYQSKCNIKLTRDGIIQTSSILANKQLNLHSKDQLVNIFHQLNDLILSLQLTINDCYFVHLYVNDMSLFNVFNDEYMKWFGRNPPSRSCIQMDLNDGVDVMLDACLYINSYEAMTSGRRKYREVVHVQCMSDWAPMCIGPYSQANVLAESIVYIAGQIPLIPGNMELLSPASYSDIFEYVCHCIVLSIRHVARILHSLDTSLHSTISCLLYINTNNSAIDRLIKDNRLNVSYIHRLVNYLLITNSNEKIDDHEKTLKYSREINTVYSNDDDSSDSIDESIEESISLVVKYPISIVLVDGLPRDAPIEVEIVSCTNRISSDSLSYRNKSYSNIDITNNLIDKYTTNSLTDDWIIWPGNSISSNQFTKESIVDIDITNITELLGRYTVSYISYDECICSGFVNYSDITNSNIDIISLLYQLLVLMHQSIFQCNLSTRLSIKYLRLYHRKDIHIPENIVDIANSLLLKVLTFTFPITILSSSYINNNNEHDSIVSLQFIAYDLLQLDTMKWINS